ncbi:MAG: hypothetical protein QME57_03745, partial [Patescibacteria group bacterium]|nr:hypothetical protein [Patescibacteria group bacterium]
MSNPFEKPGGELELKKTEESGKLEGEQISKEKAPEEKFLEEILKEKRNDYISGYREYCRTFGKMKKKDLKKFEEAIELARKYIKPGDSEILKDKGSPQYSEAVKRKENFIEKLVENRIEEKKAEAIYNTELKKAEYDRAKEELGKEWVAEGKEEAEIFQKLILEEREILNKAKVESWPPKEKGIFKKGLEWWMRRSSATRLLISTGLVTGVVAASGGFSAPAIPLFAGQRYLRGAAAILVGKLAGKGVDWVMEKRIKAKEAAALSELKEEFSVEKLKEIDKKYEKILEKTIGKRRKKLIFKAGVMAAAGLGTIIGL